MTDPAGGETTIRDPLPEDICPGPPENPYPPSSTWSWTHRWVPLAMLDVPGVPDPGLVANAVRVIEVCPTCHQWRGLAYTRLDPSPRDGG